MSVFSGHDISSTIISFSSDNANLSCVLFWSESGFRVEPASFGMPKAVLTVVPLILIAATPVGAIRKTDRYSRLVAVCLNAFVTVWYIVLIRWLLPAPPPQVRKICISSTFCGSSLLIFFTLFRHHWST